METTKHARVAIYIRVSTQHQVDKDSLPMQRKDLIAYSKLILGTDDYVIYEDAGYSGKNTDRPNYQKMMSKIRAGAFTHLLVWKIDRISRNLVDFANMYDELKRLGVTFVSKSEQFDTSTAMGEAMLKIILVFAELERNMTSERVTAAMISRASDGQWNGGKVPFGYSYDKDSKTFSIVDAEADTVRVIHNKYEELRSLVLLSRYLNSNGYKSRNGTLWSPVTVRLVLRNVFNCGDYRYNMLLGGSRQRPKDKSEWVTVTDHHPAIVSREQKERCIAIMEENAKLNKERGLYSTRKHTHIFGNVLICDECGKSMHPTISNTDRRHVYSKYLCHTSRKNGSCSARSTSDPVIGEIFFNYILRLLSIKDNAELFSSPTELEQILLNGRAFDYIDHIDSSSLEDLFAIIKSYDSSSTSLFSAEKHRVQTQEPTSELTSLRNRLNSLERAISRLTDLYLYSDESMSEAEFILKKTDLTSQIDNITKQISTLTSGSFNNAISDEAFVLRASEFVLSQELLNKNYVSFYSLADSVDRAVLKSFVDSIVDSIFIRNGKISKIVFNNGLVQIFHYKQKNAPEE